MELLKMDADTIEWGSLTRTSEYFPSDLLLSGCFRIGRFVLSFRLYCLLQPCSVGTGFGVVVSLFLVPGWLGPPSILLRSSFSSSNFELVSYSFTYHSPIYR